ncbi:MAG: 5-(carboxyamino)imidazole ribonucleotide mutase [Actinobacteria bacterium]|nr:5-(carboxyamino)imidazole ribonucleotide mutase [Actinomycetota bacterium]
MGDKNTLVGIVMGSTSDRAQMRPAEEALARFGIDYEVRVVSAHRSPKLAHDYAASAASRGVAVIIAAAGKAAHLAGVMASLTTIPIIGVPMKTSDLGGMDSLLSTVQMPSGVPVATVGIGAAENAAILAAEILSLSDSALADKLAAYKMEMASKIEGVSFQE